MSTPARIAICFVALAACGPKKPPPAPAAPRGELLRFAPKVGERVSSKVNVVIEQQRASRQGEKQGGATFAIEYQMREEETVDSVIGDGSAQISARLLDVVGKPSDAQMQTIADDMSLAFDELKIQLKRTARGEVTSLSISGVRKPLDEVTARTVLSALYHAQRGPWLPEGRVDVGDAWREETPLPGSSAYKGTIAYDYKLARKDGNLAVIDSSAKIDGKGGGGGVVQRISGNATGEHRFDIAAGKLIGYTVDETRHIDDIIPGQVMLQMYLRQRMKIIWESQ